MYVSVKILAVNSKEVKWSEVKWKSLSRVQLFATPWTIYSPWNSPGQNTGVDLFPAPGDIPNPGIEPRSPALQVDSLPAEPPGKQKEKNETKILVVHLCYRR